MFSLLCDLDDGHTVMIFFFSKSEEFYFSFFHFSHSEWQRQDISKWWVGDNQYVCTDLCITQMLVFSLRLSCLDSGFHLPFHRPVVLCVRYSEPKLPVRYLDQFFIFSKTGLLGIPVSFPVTCECTEQIPWDRWLLPVLGLQPLAPFVGSGTSPYLIPGHLKLLKSFSWGIWPIFGSAFLKWR